MNSEKRIPILLIVVSLLFAALSACAYKGNGYADEDDLPVNSSDPGTTDAVPAERQYDLGFDCFVPTFDADDFLNIYEINIPEKINGMMTTFLDMPEKFKCLLLLSELLSENGIFKIGRELGCYDMRTKEYEKITKLNDDQNIGVAYCDEEIVVLKSFYGGESFSGGNIDIFFLSDNSHKIIHDYQVNRETGAVNVKWYDNKIIRLDNCLYYDDLFDLENGLFCWNLYCYDISADSETVFCEHSQNPMIFDEKIVAFTRNEEYAYRCLSVLPDEKLMDIDVNLRSIDSNGENIFCITVTNEDPNSLSTIALYDLLNDETILTTNYGIGNIEAGECYVTFSGADYGYPFIYDIDSDSLLIMDGLPVGYGQIHNKQNFGWMVWFSENEDDADILDTQYFFFEKR